MSKSDAPQSVLFPPDVLEVTLTFGFVPSQQHGQWQLEARNPTDGQLLAMVAHPHFELPQLLGTFVLATEAMVTMIQEHLLPF